MINRRRSSMPLHSRPTNSRPSMGTDRSLEDPSPTVSHPAAPMREMVRPARRRVE
jgi:hypothetical protein